MWTPQSEIKHQEISFRWNSCHQLLTRVYRCAESKGSFYLQPTCPVVQSKLAATKMADGYFNLKFGWKNDYLKENKNGDPTTLLQERWSHGVVPQWTDQQRVHDLRNLDFFIKEEYQLDLAVGCKIMWTAYKPLLPYDPTSTGPVKHLHLLFFWRERGKEIRSLKTVGNRLKKGRQDQRARAGVRGRQLSLPSGITDVTHTNSA